MTAKEVQERYDAGTYDPFAREDLAMQVPEEWRAHAVQFESGEIGVDWRSAALTNLSAHLSDDPEWSFYSVSDNIDYASEHVHRIMAMMTADELRAVAAIESPESVTDLPYGLTIEDIGYRRGKTHRAQWINAFWYHRRNVRGYAEVPERRSPLGDDDQTANRPKWINRRPEYRIAQEDAETRGDAETAEPQSLLTRP